MGDVVDLRQRRIARLAEDLARRLRASDGRVTENVSDLAVDVETWRAAGRRAGRLLGWSIRTRVRGGTVSLVDNRPDALGARSRGPHTSRPEVQRAPGRRSLAPGDPDDG